MDGRALVGNGVSTLWFVMGYLVDDGVLCSFLTWKYPMFWDLHGFVVVCAVATGRGGWLTVLLAL